MPWRLSSASRCRIFSAVRMIDAAGRLVEHQQVGLGDQCPRQKDALLLPARQRCGYVAPPGGQSPTGRARRRASASRRHAVPRTPGRSPHAPHQHDLLHRHREVPVHRLHLRHIADGPAWRPSMVAPFKQRRTVVGWRTPSTSLSRLVLPAPLGPTSATNCPWCRCSETSASTGVPLVAKRDILYFDNRFHGLSLRDTLGHGGGTEHARENTERSMERMPRLFSLCSLCVDPLRPLCSALY
jgi:hypothetical protein